MNLLDVCRQTARRTFGIERLRPEQESAMVAVLSGHDTPVALPTGFGKSLIYQVPAMILERPTIVVSPLIALMADQERALKSRGVPVVVLHSRLRSAERRAALEQLEHPGRLVVLTTPETLEPRTVGAYFGRARPALLCVDEAHCISEWGHDFRPSYLRLGAARRRIRALRRPGIIYCATTTAVDQLAGALERARIPVVRYHGKMRAADWAAAQRQFMQPARRLIMVATSAFGMGIDKPNIRYIVHYHAPGSRFRLAYRYGLGKRCSPISRRTASSSAIRRAASSWRCRSTPSELARAISSGSSRRFVTRVSVGLGPSPITLRRRNVEACFSAGILGKSTRRAAAPAIAAAAAGSWLRVPSGRGRAILEKRGALMSGQQDLQARVHDTKPAGALRHRLQLMFEWYKGMIDESTGRLLYSYDPENDVTIGDGDPIRDIAAIWDVEVLGAFLERDDLLPVIQRSLDHFARRIVQRDGYAIVAAGGELSSIAHSAFLALALARSALPDKVQRLAPLIDGILRQQRTDGSYKVFFDAEPDSGEELYPAEAMLALLEAYRLTRDARDLDSVERGFVHYKREYYDRARVQPDSLVFFANWQSQAGRVLFEVTARPKVKDFVRTFLFELHDRVIDTGFYDRVARRPEAQACVEVACGLEGLADAYTIAAASYDRRAGDYRRCILTALGFLLRAQRTTGCTDRGRGGFGGSLANREQRIDVTGHVASGFIKSLEAGIDVPAT